MGVGGGGFKNPAARPKNSKGFGREVFNVSGGCSRHIFRSALGAQWSGEGSKPAAMRQKQAVLAAVSLSALVGVHRAMDEHVRLIPIHTVVEAVGLLQTNADIAMIICTVYFDESRMFDLLRFAREKFPAIPFVCCRLTEASLSQRSTQHVTVAAETLGADLFIDMPQLASGSGGPAPHQDFCS